MDSSNYDNKEVAVMQLEHLAKRLEDEAESLTDRPDLDCALQLRDTLTRLTSHLQECVATVANQAAHAQRLEAAAGRLSECLVQILRAELLNSSDLSHIEDPGELLEAANAREGRLIEALETSATLVGRFRDLGLTADAAAQQFDELDAGLRGALDGCLTARKESQRLVQKRLEEEAAVERESARRRQESEMSAAAEVDATAQSKAENFRRMQRLEDNDAKADCEQRAAENPSATVAGTAEAEEERRWLPTVFDVAEGSAEFDFGSYGCAVRAPDGALESDACACRLLPMQNAQLATLPSNVELVGNVVQFESPPGANNCCWYILLPHCAQRLSSRETVVYVHQDGKWSEQPSAETHVDSLEFQTRWVEARFQPPAVTAVAVNKLKTDRFSVGRAGVRFCSSVDGRVCLSVPEEAVKIRLDQALEVQPIDSATLAQVKAGLPKETQGLLTCSSIVQHCSPRKNTLKPVTFSFPLPLNPAGNSRRPQQQQRRPGTAEPRAAQFAALTSRPLTARFPALLSRSGEPGSDTDDEFVILAGSEGASRGGAWSLAAKVELEEDSGKDIMSFRSSRMYDRRFLAFRVKSDFNPDLLGRICNAIERSLEEKSACFIIRQKSENLTDVMVALTTASKVDRTLRHMQESGYDCDQGMHSATEEMKVRERQLFRLRYRGNIVSEGDNPDSPAEFVMLFNSQMRGRLHITVAEKDRFAQRALEQYRGFLEIFTDAAVPKPGSKDAKKPGGPPVVVTEEVNVARLLIGIPKSAENLRVKSAFTTQFSFRAKDAVTAEYLRELAELISDNWELLAEMLDVSRKRCSVIKRNNESPQKMAHDMLVTWVKRLPVLKSKVLILCRALQAAGHPQLAASLREMDCRRQHGE